MPKNVENKEATIKMVKEQKPDTTAKNKVLTFTLPESGIEVVMDFKKNTGKLLDEARTVNESDTTGFAVTRYIIANIATFNGETFTPEDICNLDAFDVLELEATYGAARKKPAK